MATERGDHTAGVVVRGEDGWQGSVEPALVTASPGGSPDVPRVLVRLPDSANSFLIPAEMLQRQSDGMYFLPLRRADLPTFMDTSSIAPTVPSPASAPSALSEQIVVPIVEEQVTVGKRVVESGRVRIHTTVQEREEVIDQALLREEVTVHRVPVNQVIDAPPSVRQEGDTLIVPLVEEVLVWEKRLVLKEELHVRRQTVTVHEPQTVTLRKEDAHIERVPSNRSGGGDGSTSASAAAANPPVADKTA